MEIGGVNRLDADRSARTAVGDGDRECAQSVDTGFVQDALRRIVDYLNRDAAEPKLGAIADRVVRRAAARADVDEYDAAHER